MCHYFALQRNLFNMTKLSGAFHPDRQGFALQIQRFAYEVVGDVA